MSKTLTELASNLQDLADALLIKRDEVVWMQRRIKQLEDVLRSAEPIYRRPETLAEGCLIIEHRVACYRIETDALEKALKHWSRRDE